MAGRAIAIRLNHPESGERTFFRRVYQCITSSRSQSIMQWLRQSGGARRYYSAADLEPFTGIILPSKTGIRTRSALRRQLVSVGICLLSSVAKLGVRDAIHCVWQRGRSVTMDRNRLAA